MSSHDEGRREALKIIGSIGGTCAYPFGANELYGQQTPVAPPKQVHQHAGPPERVPAVPVRPRPGYFSDAEFEMVSRLADLIIPETDTPGAVGAGVPAYIDSVAGGNAELQSIIRPGLKKLDDTSVGEHDKVFLQLTEEQQVAVLTPWAEAADKRLPDHDGGKFFRAIKNLTADGYYTSSTGLVQELGYKGNTVLEHFPEMQVPEH
jgi:gluconate 2-dehydrogenase gamma chain